MGMRIRKVRANTVIVRLLDDCLGKTVTRFLAMPVCNVATAQSLFSAFETELVSCSIPWDNVVRFASDSASEMVGAHNSISSCVTENEVLCSVWLVCAA